MKLLGVEEVNILLKVKDTKAYYIIRQLNAELEANRMTRTLILPLFSFNLSINASFDRRTALQGSQLNSHNSLRER